MLVIRVFFKLFINLTLQTQRQITHPYKQKIKIPSMRPLDIIQPIMPVDIMDSYYLLNNIWYYGNLAMMPLFFIAMINRFKHPELHKHLWTDHLCRISLIFTMVFYVFDMIVKMEVDGSDSICQKSFFIHHASSMFILPPLILNDYIPWWANPIGFFHGICIFFPEFEPINYVYAFVLFVFQYGAYQKPYADLKYYWATRYFMNYIWVFALLLLIGDCSNYLPLHP